MFENKSVIVILGPTASGKTSISLDLADVLDIEIISADSRQIYKYMDIGTASPTKEELGKVPHHFISSIEPDEYYSAGIFEKEALERAEMIFSRNKTPVLVGGSGLYIKGFCEGLFDELVTNSEKEGIRKKLEIDSANNGIDFLYNKLIDADPVSAKLYSDKNPVRIIRALTYYLATGVPFSEAHKNSSAERDFKIHYFGISFERQLLYSRINQRTVYMWDSGLPEETESILDKGYSPELNSLNTVGYKESIKYLKNELSKEEAIIEIQKNTRRYAKRQMTWFRKTNDINWFDAGKQDFRKKIIEQIIRVVKN